MERTIDIIAGARPNFMKVAAIIDAISAAAARGSRLRFRLIHTGQHYDRNMSASFFDQLGIPQPNLNLEVGSGTAAEQAGAIMVRYERALALDRSDLCLVVGDVTSTMACAISAQKCRVPVAHVEAGIRSGDWTMPEEINRLVTDAISNFYFTTSEFANANLRQNGADEKQILFVGNTMIDTLLKHRPQFRRPEIWDRIGLRESGYFVLTIHRPSNVDDEKTLNTLIRGIAKCVRGRAVIFPVHPRTARKLAGIGEIPSNLHLIEPMGYFEFNFLVEHAMAVITDSGGITEEATVLGVPCMTVRDSTERPETIALGTNVMIGTEASKFEPHFTRLFAGQWKKGQVPPLWDGHAGERIVKHLECILAE